MLIRKLDSGDEVASSKLFAIAYEASTDVTAPQGFGRGPCWGAFEDGVLFSQMQCLPFKMRFDGQWIPMGGVAGVSTLPQYRRRGGVRALFHRLLEVMRDEGQVFSVLYPFEFGFYRQFGYEAVYRESRVTIPLSILDRLPKPHSVRFHEPDDSIEDLNAIYERFVADRGLAVQRPADYWAKRILPGDPYKERRHTYVIAGPAGDPCAYFIFSPGSSDQGRSMRIRDWAAAGAEGVKALFGFIGTYRSHFETVEFTMPSDLLPDLMMAEYYDVRCSTAWSGMLRVVDVEAALRLARWPAGQGRLVIRVLDDTFDWNNDTFAVTFESGKAAVSRVHEEPDFSADVRALARMLVGTVGLDEPSAGLIHGLHVATHDMRPLGALFPRKLTWLNDHF